MLIPSETWNKKLKNLTENLTGGYWSQQNEAEIVSRIFEICKPKNKWCVEFGAGDGKNLSNTYHFIKKLGWKSVQIEFRESEFEMLKDNHGDNLNVKLVRTLIRPKVKTYNGDFTDNADIETTLDRCGVPEGLDLMSIDIDSHDYEVWRGMDRYRPNVMVIECNPHEFDLSVLSYDPSWSQLTGDKWYGGASIGLLNKLAEEKGYYFVCADTCNGIYVDKEFAKPLLI